MATFIKILGNTLLAIQTLSQCCRSLVTVRVSQEINQPVFFACEYVRGKAIVEILEIL